MDPTAFRRIEELYHDTLAVPPAEREAYIQVRCAGDPDTEKRLKELLSFEDKFDGRIDVPPDDLAAELVSSEDLPDLSGTELGNFRIISRIGQGGMGTVYLAEDQRLGRRLALKFVNGTMIGSTAALSRFEREAQTVSSLNHPNILTVYDIGETESVRYIATEYIEGVTLRERLKQGQMELAEIADIAVQIASALKAAHDAGIIHRDIKPGNIMIRPDGLVKVLDFGVAKLIKTGSGPEDGRPGGSASSNGVIVGTSGYMSPEQASAGEIDDRTDIYSFGVVLFQMLTGKVSLDSGVSENEGFPAVNGDSQAEPARLALKNIVSKAIRRDRDERFASMGDMLVELQAYRRDLRSWQDFLEGRGSGAFQAVDSDQTISGTGRRRKGFFVGITGILLVLVALSGYYLYKLYAVPADPGIDAVAVMPIANRTGDAGLDFVADGITESLISRLSHLPTVSIKAWSSVFSFKGREVSASEAGRELSVDTVVLGNISRSGDDLVFSFEIVDAATGNRIWGRDYKRKPSDIASLQNSIAGDVVDELDLAISPLAEDKVRKGYTTNPAAYQHYLKAQYQWNKRTPDGIRLAMSEYKSAVEADPGFGLAYVGLADAYVLLENYSGDTSPERLRRARAYAMKALATDSTLPEAHASLGLILHRSWEWEAAEREYRTAIKLKPSYAPARHWYSLFLREQGRFEESLAESKVAERLDPLSGIIIVNLAGSYLVLDDSESAVSLLRRSLEMDGDYPWVHSMLALAEAGRGNFESAVEEAERGNALAPKSVNAISIKGYVLAKAGKREEAKKIAGSLIARYDEGTSAGRNIARVYAGLGERDKAFEWLEKDFDAHSAFLPYISWTPPFQTLRSDPRFTDLLKRMGIPAG